MGFEDYHHTCEKGPAHQGKQIIMVCLNAQCDAKRLCCLTCIDTLHRKHELISLYKFEDMLAVLTRTHNQQQRSQIVKQLLEFQEAYNTDLQKTLESFRKFTEQCRKKMRETMQLAVQSVTLTLNQEHLELLYQDLNNASLCKYLDLIRQAEGEALKDPEATAKTLSIAGTVLNKSISDARKLFDKGMQEVANSLDRLRKVLSSHSGPKKPAQFSKTHKAASIEVSQDGQTAHRSEGAGSYPIVLFQDPLTEANPSVTVTIKQQPGNRGCWLGVCVLDIVKNYNFMSCYGMGKGSWAIDQVGASHASAYSWSHHDATYNSQPKVGFQFAPGDSLTLRLDTQKSTIRFEKGAQIYEMPVQLELGAIHAFVGCTHLGDTWAITP